jgi:hypothetical protein
MDENETTQLLSLGQVNAQKDNDDDKIEEDNSVTGSSKSKEEHDALSDNLED